MTPYIFSIKKYIIKYSKILINLIRVLTCLKTRLRVFFYILPR